MKQWSETNNARVKVLICEGTQVHKALIESEENMRRQLQNLLEAGDYDYFLVKYNFINWDHFRIFMRSAEKFGWRFIISEKDANYYHLLNKDAIYKTMRAPNIRRDDIIIIVKELLARYPWQVKIRQMHDKMKNRTIVMNALKSFPRNFCLHLKYFNESILEKINSNLKGAFISSSTEKDREEATRMEKSFIKKLTRQGLQFSRIHASEHAMAYHIWKLIDEINLELVFHVHTKHLEMFQEFLNNKSNKTIIPLNNEHVKI